MTKEFASTTPTTRTSSSSAAAANTHMKNSSSSSKKSPSLAPSKVYVRLRPMVYDGSGHDQDGPGVAKSLECYTDDTITLQTQYMFSKGSNEYTFPTRVLQPQSSQQDVYQEVVPPLLQQVVGEGVDGHDDAGDAMLLAYGQTATGKTVTIFGFEPSLQRAIQQQKQEEVDGSTTRSSPAFVDVDPEWGILPRLTFDLFSKFQPKKGKTVIALSCIEFYLGYVFDLLRNDDDYDDQDDETKKENNNSNTNDSDVDADVEIQMDADNKPAGYKRIVLDHPNDIFPIIQTILQRRSSRGTHMNHSSQNHGGSSRSHCSIMFTILHQPPQSPKFRQTTFHLVDLAGAERPSKVGQGQQQDQDQIQDTSGQWAAYKLQKGETITAFEEGLLINYTLFEFCKEVKLATELHKKNKPYKAPRQMGMPLTKYLGRCIDGRALLSMIVCISQAPQCGWETWFSMNYGTDLASLCTPLWPAKSFDLSKAIQRCTEIESKATNALVKHEQNHGTSDINAPNIRRWHRRKRIDLQEAKERLRLLKVLKDKQQSS